MAEPSFEPADFTQIDPGTPENLHYWARTLETDPDKLKRAIAKVGPVLETVKKELGISGV